MIGIMFAAALTATQAGTCKALEELALHGFASNRKACQHQRLSRSPGMMIFFKVSPWTLSHCRDIQQRNTRSRSLGLCYRSSITLLSRDEEVIRFALHSLAQVAIVVALTACLIFC